MKRLISFFLTIALCCTVFCSCNIQIVSEEAHPRLIAHGGGAVYGYRLTNSLEAIDTAYANGFRYIELDFEQTSDGVYVLLHDWESMAGRLLLSERVHTHEEFLSAATFQDLTLLDLDGLLAWLETHTDVRIITDAKCQNLPFLQTLAALPAEQRARFIPQAYSLGELASAKAMGFSDVILTLYAMDYDEAALLAFVKENQPWAVTIPDKYLSEHLLSALSEQGIVTYTHTVNDLSYYEMWHEKGLYGIYTDYFVPQKWVN